MSQDKIQLNKRTEGDINFSPARKAWQDTEIDEKTKELLDKDARYFFTSINVYALFRCFKTL